MKPRTRIYLFYTICFLIVFASLEATPEPYLFELFSMPNYKKSWNEMLSGEKKVDKWLAEYAIKENGPATPGKSINLGKEKYMINMVCKTHSCGDNKFFVMFNHDGTRAWGLLLKSGAKERFFGKPDEVKKVALRAAVYN